jgi:RND superfamily putative drug exporter
MPDWASWAQLIVRYRGLVLVTWLVAAGLLLPASRRVTQSLDVTARVRGSESAAVDSALRTRFDSPYSNWAALVITGGGVPSDSAGRSLLRTISDSLQRVPGVTRTLSWLNRSDTMFVGRDGMFLVVGLEADRSPDALMATLHAARDTLQRALRHHTPGLTMRWTGFLPVNYDLRRTGSADVAVAETRALPLTLVLLLWAFGAVIAALLPLLAGFTAIGMALGVTVLLARLTPLSILLVNVVTMIGLGLGIDYALLMVSRFREAIAAGHSPAEAAAVAAAQAGHTIAISGLTVVIGFAALLGVQLTELRSIAWGGLIVTLVSMLIAMTLLPAVLSGLGSAIELGRVRRRMATVPSPRWQAWGAYVTRRPWTVLIVAGAPIVLLALQTLRLNSDVESSDWLPRAMESGQGVEDLKRMGRRAVIATMPMILELPAGTLPAGEKSWQAMRRLGDWITVQPGIARVRSLPAVAGATWSPGTALLLSPDARHTFISRDRRAVMLDVLPREDADRHDLSRLVQRLRGADAAALTGLPGARVQIGGIPAFHVDYGAAVKRRFGVIVTLAITGTLLALFVGFRSVLVPLKAVALNLLSVLAALGVVVLVFQDGHGYQWLGLDRPVGGVFSSIPLLVFCIVFGLSMDYEVFLVARVREARHAGLAERAALVEGLARTAGVITSAAAIMVAVFAAFALGQFVLVKMLGLALAVAVALDATVVRLAIGPALLCLAGKWNWWPGMPVTGPDHA